jgi:hypothetical protein
MSNQTRQTYSKFDSDVGIPTQGKLVALVKDVDGNDIGLLQPA